MRRRRRGMALVLALWAAVLAFMLGVAYLALLIADDRQAAHQRAEVEARWLARAGLEAYRAGGLPELGLEPARFYPDPEEPTRYVVVDRPEEPPGVVRLVGTVTDAGGRAAATRTLLVPETDVEAWYEGR